MAGLVLSGAEPVWVAPEVDDVERARARRPASRRSGRRSRARPDARAVMLVEPSYLGLVSDIEAIAELVHEHGVPLICDQAWGAHLGFHPGHPRDRAASRRGRDRDEHAQVDHELHAGRAAARPRHRPDRPREARRGLRRAADDEPLRADLREHRPRAGVDGAPRARARRARDRDRRACARALLAAIDGRARARRARARAAVGRRLGSAAADRRPRCDAAPTGSRSIATCAPRASRSRAPIARR